MINIRRATPEDFDQIWPMLHHVFAAGETYAVDPNITKSDAFDYWMGQAKATYVAEGPAGIVGTYYIKTNQPGGGAHVCNCGYIVDHAARGQGLAAQMCEHSQKEAQGLGYRAMQFNFVLASNAGAVRLWHRLGFATVGTLPEAFAHPKHGYVDAFVMFKQLTDAD